jgi:hypothetical protein
MRWHDEALTIKGMPGSSSAQLVGVLNVHDVSVNVEFYHNGRQFVAPFWTKQIRMWQHEAPTKDEIANKFWDKLSKVKSRNEELQYTEWLKYFTTHLSESDKKDLESCSQSQ